MSRPEFCGPREPASHRLARLGVKSRPPSSAAPQRVIRTKRYYRDLDEISFNKPNPNKTK
jgi:hypothetical protein